MNAFRRMIADRRNGYVKNREDFLQSMLERDPLSSDEKLDDSEIMDNLLTLIIAGQTTTAAAIMWSVKFLDENREAQERLRVRIRCIWSFDHVCINPKSLLYLQGSDLIIYFFFLYI